MSSSNNPVFRHPKRPDWGMGIVAQDLPDLICTVFESGRTAKFFKTALPIVMVDLPDAERATLYARLKRSNPASGKRAAARKPKIALVEATSFEHQLSIFAGMFPKGFLDPDFILQERAPASGPKAKGHEAATVLAQDLLSRVKLMKAIEGQRFPEILASAVSVAKATSNMAHPQFEVAPLAAMEIEHQEKFALALLGVLHGEGDYAPRFDAFVASLPTPFWTLATIFSALVRPGEHFFAKPKIEQRQAKILGIEEPPGGVPTHEGYLRYLAVGEAVRAGLVKAGQQPRDLLDVYSFIAATLSAKPAKVAKAPKAPKAPKVVVADAPVETSPS